MDPAWEAVLAFRWWRIAEALNVKEWLRFTRVWELTVSAQLLQLGRLQLQ